MRVTLIVNPAASSVTLRARIAVEDALGTAHDLQVVDTARRLDATALARSAAADGADVVAVLAGDGTLNEAAAGLTGTTTALAALPGGSTNVFARTLGIAYRPAPAAQILLDSLARKSFRRIGIGRANDRPFLFHLGTGFDAAVVREIESVSYVKRYFAHPAFALAGVDTWWRRYDRGTRLRVDVLEFDGTAPHAIGTGPYAVVSNSSPYTYVGRRPVVLAPGASLDGKLAITVAKNLRLGMVLRTSASALGRQRFLTESTEIVQRVDVDRLRIVSDRPFPWQVDGDYLGETDLVDVSFEPDALTLVVP